MYTDKLVYNVVTWVFWGYFMEREESFNLKCWTIYMDD